MMNDLETKLDNIESLLRLMLVNNIMINLEYDGNSKEKTSNKTIQQDKLLEKEFEILNDLGVKRFEVYSNVSNRFVVILECDTFELNYIREINKVLKKTCKDIVPVFYFNKLAGLRKNKISTEKISYMVAGKEININLVVDKSRKK